MTTTRAGVYCRISRDRVGAGLGVERQEQDCRDLAASLGWEIADVYVDNDLSAYSGKPRPQYERALTDLEAGRITAVLAWHTDRLHRSPTELERYIAVCEPRGVPTRTVRAGELDLSTAAGRMTARITGAVARHESEQKGERVKRQKQQAQAQGRWTGGRRPFGFEPDGATVREVEAEAIRDATRRILAGDSIRSIVREWNAAGLTTTTGTPWDATRVRQMLLRPRNAGLVGNRARRVVGPAVWPAIVERETWQALVALLSDPSRTTHRGTSLRLLGSGLFHCWCGALVRSGGNSAAGRPRYTCTAVSSHVRRVAEPVDEMVTAVVEVRLGRPDVADLLAPTPADAAPLRERLDVLRARADEIATLFGDGDMTGAQFRRANERVQGEMREIEAELGRQHTGTALAGIADADDPVAAFREASIERRRAVVDLLVTVSLSRGTPGRNSSGAYFDPDSVEITRRSV